jgi:hypothetical protein
VTSDICIPPDPNLLRKPAATKSEHPQYEQTEKFSTSQWAPAVKVLELAEAKARMELCDGFSHVVSNKSTMRLATSVCEIRNLDNPYY